MEQHALTHLFNDKLPALYILFCPLALLFQFLNDGSLLIVIALQLILLLHERIAGLSDLIKFLIGFTDLLLVAPHQFLLLLLGGLDLPLDVSFTLARSHLKLLEFFLAGLNLFQVHLFHICKLLLSPLDCVFQVGDRLKTHLRRRLIFNKSSLQCIVLLLGDDCTTQGHLSGILRGGVARGDILGVVCTAPGRSDHVEIVIIDTIHGKKLLLEVCQIVLFLNVLTISIADES